MAFPLQRGRLMVELAKRACGSTFGLPNSKRQRCGTATPEQSEDWNLRDISINSSLLETDPDFSFDLVSEKDLDISSILAQRYNQNEDRSTQPGNQESVSIKPATIQMLPSDSQQIGTNDYSKHPDGATERFDETAMGPFDDSTTGTKFCDSSIMLPTPEPRATTSVEDQSYLTYGLQETVSLLLNDEKGTTLEENQSQTEISDNQRAFNNALIACSTPRTHLLESTMVENMTSPKFNKQRSMSKRLQGKRYVGRHLDTEARKYTFVERDARTLRGRCACKSKGTKCGEIEEEDMRQMFSYFWDKLSTWEEKRLYVKTLVDVLPIHGSKKRAVFKYHLKVGGVRKAVCAKLFCNTFDISDWLARTWCNKEKTKERKQHAHCDRGITRKMHCVDNFLKRLNTLPSHYCRKSTSKQYLERQFRSYTDVHHAYKEQCQKDNIQPLGIKVFTSIMHDCNIALFMPRKDQCDVCVQHEVGNLTEEKWIVHRVKYKAAQEEKKKDKLLAETDGSVLIITMDLQAVLLSPSLQASSLYYKTKLAVHNFTIYNLTTNDVDCYLWHEAEGGLTANEFCSCLHDFMSKNLVTGQYKKVLIYSDGCTYQNRNKSMSKMLLHVCHEYGITVEQKFLEKGHTQMECDSVHATIEGNLKRNGRPCNIYSPVDYMRIIETARKAKHPYKVHYLSYDFFKSFDDVTALASIRPGKMVGDPTVTDLRALQYNPEGDVWYKLNHDDHWKILPRSRSDGRISTFNQPKQLYSAQRKISPEKYNHLKQMKDVLPKDVHDFYNNLPH